MIGAGVVQEVVDLHVQVYLLAHASGCKTIVGAMGISPGQHRIEVLFV